MKQPSDDDRNNAAAGAAIVHGLTRSRVGLDCLASFTPEQREAAAALVRAHEDFQRDG